MTYPAANIHTRPGWGGANSDVSLHIEEHLGLVDASFMYSSKFASWMNVRSLRGTNQLRVDRVGASTIAGRKAGEELVVQKNVSDKLNLTVDTVLYARHFFDKFDEWTSNLDVRKETAREDGIALARQYDQACIIQLQKCGDFLAPAHLKPAFHDGILLPSTISGAPADASADADILVAAHRQGVEAMVFRDLGDQLMSEGVTLLDPVIFSFLLEHDRLMNVEFGAKEGGNSFVGGRIAMLNGVRVVETPRFPQSAITANALGAGFNVTAAEVRRKMITFIPSMALISAQVHPVSAQFWEEKKDFGHYLDTFQSYNIGQRRPDAVAVHDITVTNP